MKIQVKNGETAREFESPKNICWVQGYIQCEKLAQLDLKVRGHKKAGGIALNELMNITDSIQGIFDYV